MFKNRLVVVLTLCIGIAIGVLLVWGVNRLSVPSSWFEVDANRGTWLSDQVVESDIPLAKVVSLKGRARFIDHDPASPSVGVGYILDLELSRIDPAKIPGKYSLDRPVTGSSLKELAVTIPYYTTQFYFELRDKDGFIVQTITGQEHNAYSGKVNRDTGQTKLDVSRQKAAIVRSVTVQTSFKATPGERKD